MTKWIFSPALILVFPVLAFGSDDWQRYKGICTEGSPDSQKTEVSADFDGNGIADIARLEQNLRTKVVRVAIWLNRSKSPLSVFESKEDIGQSLDILPSRRKSPNFFSEKEIKKYPALIYSSCAVFDAYFFWDHDKKTFQSVWDRN